MITPNVVAVNRQTGLSPSSYTTLDYTVLAAGARHGDRLVLALGYRYSTSTTAHPAPAVAGRFWDLDNPAWDYVTSVIFAWSNVGKGVGVLELWTCRHQWNESTWPVDAVPIDEFGDPLGATWDGGSAGAGAPAGGSLEAICTVLRPSNSPGDVDKTGNAFDSSTVTPAFSGVDGSGDGRFVQVHYVGPGQGFAGVNTANGYTVESSAHDRWRVSSKAFTADESTTGILFNLDEPSNVFGVFGSLTALVAFDDDDSYGWYSGMPMGLNQ